MEGLNLLTVQHDGASVFEYMPRYLAYDRDFVSKNGKGPAIPSSAPVWLRSTFNLPASDVSALVDTVNELGIFGMDKAFHAPTQDGTQWCLLIKTGDRQKTIYCNNYFPKPILDLSQFIHELIIDPHVVPASDTAVPKAEWRDHEKEIWESLH